MLCRFGLAILLIFACVSAASAGALVWTLNNAVFTDNGTVSGSFSYDADTNTYSSINIVSTAASSFPGHTYTFLDPYMTSSATGLDTVTSASPTAGDPFLSLAFLSALTDAGGVISLSTGSGGESYCAGTCNGTGGSARFYVSGTVSASVDTRTPEPGTLLLFGAGLAVLPYLCRRLARR